MNTTNSWQKILVDARLTAAAFLLSIGCVGCSWKEVATTGPSSYGHVLGYDQAGRQTLLFTGVPPSGPYDGQTWTWNGSVWTHQTPAGDTPPPRYKAAMASDTDRNRVVLFGGIGLNGVELQDTWEWDGSKWNMMSPATPPRTRHHHAMAYDADRHVIVMYGGFTANPGPTDLKDTWEWNGMNWTQVQTTQNPGGMNGLDGHAMAYDQWRHVTVLYGGTQDTGSQLVLPNQTWEYNGQDWQNVTPADPNNSPPARGNAALVYNESITEVMVFGGSDGSSKNYDDTWMWDGTKWAQFSSSPHPDARTQHAMAYDRLRNRVVLFGGFGAAVKALGDTWEFTAPSPLTPRPFPKP